MFKVSNATLIRWSKSKLVIKFATCPLTVLFYTCTALVWFPMNFDYPQINKLQSIDAAASDLMTTMLTFIGSNLSN